jgi:hypothetical protein
VIFAMLALLAASPLLALVGALFSGAVLFWPVMLLLGAVHTHLPWVPPLGAGPTFLVVALLYLLIPTGTASSTNRSS